MPIDKHPAPRKRKPTKSPRDSKESLESRLKAHPQLHEKLLEVLDAAENKGNIEEADAAEELVVELIQDLGVLTLQTWAENQQTLAETAFVDAHPDARNKGKKTPVDQ